MVRKFAQGAGTRAARFLAQILRPVASGLLLLAARSLPVGLALASPALLFAENGLDAVYNEAIGKPRPAEPHVQLRRMSLHLRGVIPTVAEVRQFQKTAPASRRQVFAYRFLKDADFAHYQAIRFGDMLRDRTDQRGAKFGSFYEYISQSLHANKPYNQMVTEMLTATGTSDGSPAVNYFLRDDADPLQMAEYVGRAFYGRRFSCARCHDHPFDRSFTRRDYYGLAAFFSQAYVKREKQGAFVPRNRMEDFPEAERKKYEQAAREWRRNTYDKMSQAQRKKFNEQNRLKYWAIAIEPELGLRFPYSDNAPGGDIVKPKFPDGQRPFLEKGDDRRKVFARWLTAQKNDRFRKVLINRIWTDLMGWSFFTPLDDWTPETKLTGAPILDHLDQVFLEKGYRIKDLMYYIVTSDAYVRIAPAPRGNRPSSNVYYQPRRMNPSQLLNSMLRGTHMKEIGWIGERALATQSTAAALDFRGTGALKGPEKKNRKVTNACEIPRPVNYNSFLSVFGEGDRNDLDEYEDTPTVDQVLALLNGNVSTQAWRNAGKNDSFYAQDYARHKDMTKTFDLVFESLLSRPMTAAEGERLKDMISSKYQRREQKFDRGAVEDLVWSIVNSQEFLHIY